MTTTGYVQHIEEWEIGDRWTDSSGNTWQVLGLQDDGTPIWVAVPKFNMSGESQNNTDSANSHSNNSNDVSGLDLLQNYNKVNLNKGKV